MVVKAMLCERQPRDRDQLITIIFTFIACILIWFTSTNALWRSVTVCRYQVTVWLIRQCLLTVIIKLQTGDLRKKLKSHKEKNFFRLWLFQFTHAVVKCPFRVRFNVASGISKRRKTNSFNLSPSLNVINVNFDDNEKLSRDLLIL